MVVSVEPHSLAAKCGVKVGNILDVINGELTFGMTEAQVDNSFNLNVFNNWNDSLHHHTTQSITHIHEHTLTHSHTLMPPPTGQMHTVLETAQRPLECNFMPGIKHR